MSQKLCQQKKACGAGPPLFIKGSREKIQIWMGKAPLVVQGAEKFAPPKSAGYFRSPESPPDFRKGTPAR
jgi:hypothetical protein